MRGKKSRTASLALEAVTVERTLVFSIAKTTAALAKRAILPVSSVITLEPISNCSVKVSRCLVVAKVRKRKARHVRKCGKVRRSVFVLLIGNRERE